MKRLFLKTLPALVLAAGVLTMSACGGAAADVTEDPAVSQTQVTEAVQDAAFEFTPELEEKLDEVLRQNNFTGVVHLNWETVCLMDMAKEVFEKLKPFYEEKNLTVHFLGETFDVLADRNRMEQLITNLATNAVKYCTPAGSILVKVHQLEDQTWFSMENDCYRLPQKALDQIWDSFFREDSARGTKGTGLGLAIVKSIVELHNGSCRAVNTDSGLELQITLPR